MKIVMYRMEDGYVHIVVHARAQTIFRFMCISVYINKYTYAVVIIHALVTNSEIPIYMGPWGPMYIVIAELGTKFHKLLLCIYIYMYIYILGPPINSARVFLLNGPVYAEVTFVLVSSKYQEAGTLLDAQSFP